MDESEARKELSTYAKRVAYQGFVQGSEGNLSARLDNERILIKPTKKEFFKIKPEDFVVIDLKGTKIAGKDEPSSEGFLHTSIYKRRKDVNSVIHSHPDYATALFSQLEEPLRMGEGAKSSLGTAQVECLPNIRAASLELARKGSQALEKTNAIILKNHGIVAVGKDLEEAFQLTIAIEKASRWKFIGINAQTYLASKILQEEQAKILNQLKILETIIKDKLNPR